MRGMYYVDMHCHPIIKPFSWTKTKKKKNNWQCRNVESSIWYSDPPTKSDRRLNMAKGLTKFRQSDFRTLGKGHVKIASACLNPIERGLFVFKRGNKIIPPRLLKFVIEVSMKYIRLVRKKGRDYFAELEEERKFFEDEYNKQDELFPTRFELTSNYSEIETNMNNADKDKRG